MNRILITGGAGFLGRNLIRGLLDRYDDINIRSISRNENFCQQTVTFVNCPDDKLEVIIGDIRDVETLAHVLKQVDTVFHLAAMKHIDFCEAYPVEAISVNTIATMNLLRLFEGNTFIGMSTDKAVEPSGCYGATKLLLEKLVLDQAGKNMDKRFMVVRSGNIFGSSGSVVQRWQQEIRKYNRISITNPEMTRFFTKVSSMVDYMIDIFEHGETGKIFVPSQKVIQLGDLAKAVIEVFGSKETKMVTVGLRKGEKLDEKLFSSSDTNIVSEAKNDCSAHGERLSIAEIKDWLKDCEE